MRIHTDVLTSEDIYAAASEVRDRAPNIYVDSCSVHGSRKRSRAFEVALRGDGEHHTRRPNSGRFGATSDDSYATTYDDWGHWIGRLFEIDPAAVMTYYKSAKDFHAQTAGKYRRETVEV